MKIGRAIYCKGNRTISYRYKQLKAKKKRSRR